MTDVTPIFNRRLEERGARPALDHVYDLEKINSFLREAYSIHARIGDLARELRCLRPSYLSTAPQPRRKQRTADRDQASPLTDAERDAIDAQSKQLLRELNHGITRLKQTEDVRNQAADSVALSRRARSGFGAIGRWASGGATTAKSPIEEREEAERKTIAAVRESVTLFLQRRLEEAGKIQSEMMEVRLGREVEKSKSMLHKSRISGAISYAHGDGEDLLSANAGALTHAARDPSVGLDASPSSQQLSQDQLQLFASENADLLKHYEDQLDQVRVAERSILEISELHSTLHANLQQQSEHIEQLVQDSYMTTENLGRGNRELKRASERRSTARMTFWGTVGFCGFLVAWDLIF